MKIKFFSFILALFVGGLSLVHALSVGQVGGGDSLTNQTVSSGTITTLNVSTLAVTNTSTLTGNVNLGGSGGSKVLTLGGNVASDSPQITLNTGSSANGILQYKVSGNSKAQIYSGGNDLTIRTDAAIPIIFGISSSEKMRLDSSGQLNIGATTNTGNTWINISTTNAMFSIGGSTATGSGTLTTVASTPCGSDSIKGVLINLCQSNGTNCVAYYLLACPR